MGTGDLAIHYSFCGLVLHLRLTNSAKSALLHIYAQSGHGGISVHSALGVHGVVGVHGALGVLLSMVP